MKRFALLLLAALALSTPQLRAEAFFDTSEPARLFTFGARLGLNTSNRTLPTSSVMDYNHESWGLGFDAGVLVNLNFREFISVQPGFFYESRSGNYAYGIYDYIDPVSQTISPLSQMGHWRTYNFTIPVMAIMKLNLADNVKVSGEFGPYVQFQLGEQGGGITYYDAVSVPLQGNFIISYPAKRNNFDFGFKMGMGLQFYDHYYVGFHYMAGALNAWKEPNGGKNKSWIFSIGYDF